MKFVHLSDLHLGKRVNEFPMIEDQRYILGKITEIIKEEKPQAVLIAGDVYDKPVPSAEAVELFDDFISELAEMELEVFIISGNHDSAERLSFGSRIMDKRGEGVPVILSASDRLSGRQPEYKLLGESELLLTIYSVPIDDRKKLREMITSSGETTNSGHKTIKESGETIKSNNGVINKVGETINHAAETMGETISDTIKSNPGISLIGIVEKVGRSRATVARIVATLKKEGCVEYRGSKKTGGYFSIS